MKRYLGLSKPIMQPTQLLAGMWQQFIFFVLLPVFIHLVEHAHSLFIRLSQTMSGKFDFPSFLMMIKKIDYSLLQHQTTNYDFPMARITILPEDP